MGRWKTAWNALRTSPGELDRALALLDAHEPEEVSEALSLTEAFYGLAARQDQLEREFTSLSDTINRWAARDRARKQREIAAGLAARAAESDGTDGEADEPAGTSKDELRKKYFGKLHRAG